MGVLASEKWHFLDAWLTLIYISEPLSKESSRQEAKEDEVREAVETNGGRR
jgi:hypothetical protein